MAKIIVTGIFGVRYLIDSDSKFESTSHTTDRVRVTTKDKNLCQFAIRETMTEVKDLINEAEAETTNKKLDLILANQEKLLKALKIK